MRQALFVLAFVAFVAFGVARVAHQAATMLAQVAHTLPSK